MPEEKVELKYYEKASFRKQQALWYRKLKRKGFDDIEYQMRDGTPGDVLKGLNKMTILRRGIPRYEDASDYYQLASQWLWHMRAVRRHLRRTGKMERGDIRIWELHSEGRSIVAITESMGLTRAYVAGRVAEQRSQLRTAVEKKRAPFRLEGEPSVPGSDGGQEGEEQ